MKLLAPSFLASSSIAEQWQLKSEHKRSSSKLEAVSQPMRLFIALDITDAIRDRLTRFVEGVSGFAPHARWVKPESLHVTLKFIGEQPDSAVEQIQQAFSGLQASAPEIHFRGYGF